MKHLKRSDAEDDLQATVDDVHADAARLAEIETRKGDLQPADPRRLDLSLEAEELARELVVKTAAQTELVEESAEAAPETS